MEAGPPPPDSTVGPHDPDRPGPTSHASHRAGPITPIGPGRQTPHVTRARQPRSLVPPRGGLPREAEPHKHRRADDSTRRARRRAVARQPAFHPCLLVYTTLFFRSNVNAWPRAHRNRVPGGAAGRRARRTEESNVGALPHTRLEVAPCKRAATADHESTIATLAESMGTSRW